MSEQSNAVVDVEWRQIYNSKDTQELLTVSNEMLENTSRTFVESIQQLVEDEFYVLATDARKTSDGFWQMNKYMRENGGPKEQGYFGTRTRLVNNSLDCHWYKNRFHSSQGGEKKAVKSDHVKRRETGRGKGYLMSDFQGARKWEKEAIKMTEARYQLLRQRSKALSDIRAALGRYERLLDKCYQE